MDGVTFYFKKVEKKASSSMRSDPSKPHDLTKLGKKVGESYEDENAHAFSVITAPITSKMQSQFRNIIPNEAYANKMMMLSGAAKTATASKLYMTAGLVGLGVGVASAVGNTALQTYQFNEKREWEAFDIKQLQEGRGVMSSAYNRSRR